jgi:hypothetical protein
VNVVGLYKARSGTYAGKFRMNGKTVWSPSDPDIEIAVELLNRTRAKHGLAPAQPRIIDKGEVVGSAPFDFAASPLPELPRHDLGVCRFRDEMSRARAW